MSDANNLKRLRAVSSKQSVLCSGAWAWAWARADGVVLAERCVAVRRSRRTAGSAFCHHVHQFHTCYGALDSVKLDSPKRRSFTNCLRAPLSRAPDIRMQ